MTSRFCLDLSIFLWLSMSAGAVQMVILDTTRFYDSVIPGYVDIYAANPRDCAVQCFSHVRCRGSSYKYPNTCNLYETAVSYGYDASFTSGVKVASTVLPPSLRFATFAKSSSFYTLGSPAIVDSKLKLAFRENQAGFATLSDPVQLFRYSQTECVAASFSVRFSFQIQNLTSTSSDGFAFFLAIDNYLQGSTNTYLGFAANGMTSIAIEFDTFNNTSPMYNDPDGSHVAVDTNFNVTSQAVASTLPSGINLNDSSVKFAWIDYSDESSSLSVFLSTNSTKPPFALLNYTINMCSFFRPITCSSCATRTSLFPGFSVSNGYNFYQSVDILSWDLNATFSASPQSSEATCSSVSNTTFGGGSSSYSYSISASSCCKRCRSFPNCASYAFYPNQRRCFLKTNSFGSSADVNAIGGYIVPVPVSSPASFQYTSFNETTLGILLSNAAGFDDNVLTLTYDTNQIGFAYYKKPVQLLRDANRSCVPLNFKTRFAYRIHDGSPVTWAGGFAFLLLGSNVVDKANVRSAYPYDMGMYYDWSREYLPGILAVEFDTFQDAEVGDLEAGHVGVNVRFGGVSAVSVATRPLGIVINDTNTKNVWIEYNGASRDLAVFMSYDLTRPTEPILRYNVNLCEIFRGFCRACWEISAAHVGFVGKTTNYFQTTDILNWEFSTSNNTNIGGKSPVKII